MAPLLNRGMHAAGSSQARRVSEKWERYARSPEGRRRIESRRGRFARKK